MYNQIKIKRDHGINRNNETNGEISGSFRFVSTPHKKVTIIGVLMDLEQTGAVLTWVPQQSATPT